MSNGDHKVKLPMEFNSCPNCGSTERVIESAVAGAVERKEMEPVPNIFAFASQTPIFDVSRAQTIVVARKQVPVIFIGYDVCCQCGTMYAVKVEQHTGVIDMKPGPGPGPGQGQMPPGFGGGRN